MTNPTEKNTDLLAESPASFDIGKQAYIDQLRWFGGLSYQLTVQADPASIYKLIGWAGKKILDVDGYSVWLEETGELHRCISYEGVSKEYIESVERKPVNRPAHHVVSDVRSLYIPNITSDERTAPFHDDMKTEGLWGILHLPLQVEGKGFGRITYYFKREVNPPDYLFETARAFADQAGIAMERSRLLSETQIRVKRLEVVDEIASAVGSTMKPEDVFKTIGQGIRRAVPCSRFMIGTIGKEARSSHIWHLESDVEVDSVSMGIIEGFVQWMGKEVYQPSRPKRISDVRKEEMPWMSTRVQGGLKSYLFIPILQGDRCIGHFSLSDIKTDAFTAEDEELLVSVANHLGPAIRNATVYRESTEHAARLDIQNRIAKAVGSTMKPQELFQTIVREIREVVPCDRCTVGTIDRKNSRVHYWHFESDIDMEPIGDNDVDSIWWLDRVYEEKLPDNVFDYGELESPRARQMMASGLRSGLVVPILQDDQCVAHIALTSSQTGAFSAEDESMLVSIADHLGLAMRNVTLFSMAEKRASRLAVLNDLNQKITANLSLDEALKSIVRAVCELTQGDKARILLVDEETTKFIFAPRTGTFPSRRVVLFSSPSEKELPGRSWRPASPTWSGTFRRILHGSTRIGPEGKVFAALSFCPYGRVIASSG